MIIIILNLVLSTYINFRLHNFYFPMSIFLVQNIKNEKGTSVFWKIKTMKIREPEYLAIINVCTYLNKPAAKNHRFVLICTTTS